MHPEDHVIEGLIDGDTIDDLLRERALSLEAAISRCPAKEEQKMQKAEVLLI